MRNTILDGSTLDTTVTGVDTTVTPATEVAPTDSEEKKS
jgi:hypothetical protein